MENKNRLEYIEITENERMADDYEMHVKASRVSGEIHIELLGTVEDLTYLMAEIARDIARTSDKAVPLILMDIVQKAKQLENFEGGEKS